MGRKSTFVATALLVLTSTLPAPSFANETVTYTYDALGRLVTVAKSGTINNGQNAAYTYDAAGNRTNVTTSGAATLANLSISNASVTEGGTLSFTVTRSGITTTAVSASFATADGTAVQPGDYTANSGTVSFAANQTTATITVATIDDTISEATETMTVALSNPSSGATITTATGTGTINDNEPPPANLAIGNASVTEGGTLSFTVTRSGTTTTAVSASYATANGTAVAPGDYTASSGTVSFAANQTTATIPVATIDDSTSEGTETLAVTLSNPSSGATIATATGTGTITDNDLPVASISDASATEGGQLTFTVTMTGTRTSDVRVRFATSNGTAVAPADYNSQSGSLRFRPTDTSLTFNVASRQDTLVEGNETFNVTISIDPADVGLAVVGDSVGVGTIIDND